MFTTTNMCTLKGEPEKVTINPMDALARLPANFRSAPRCQAQARSGTQCRRAAVRNKRVCSMHGGKGSGAPKGKGNGKYRHGAMTVEAIAERRQARALVREIRATADV